MPENDNAAPDAIDEVLNEFFGRSVPMLRALLKERFGAPKAPRRAIVREASTDRDGADEVLNEFFGRSVPMLRALLKERFGAPKAPRRAIVREASTDRDGADEVTRDRPRGVDRPRRRRRGDARSSASDPLEAHVDEGPMTPRRCVCPRCRQLAKNLTVPARCDTCLRCGCTSDLPRCVPPKPPVPTRPTGGDAPWAA